LQWKPLNYDRAGGTMAVKKDRLDGDNWIDAIADANLFHPGGGFYEIRVKGQLDSSWSEWLEGLEVKLLDNGEMMLFGPIVDQAALLGVLNKLSHLNLILESLNKVNRKTNKETK
jgi:hypothetical protein